MEALRWKQKFAETTDAEMALATQFCFEAAPVIAWAERLKSEGIRLPIHIGIAGPAKLQTLLKFPIACGLGTDGLIRAIARVYGEAHPRASCDDHTYILLYSLIILNTDLHNDRVRRKITEDAYVESLARTQISGAILESDARRHYRSIKADPLRCGADDAAAPTRTGRARLFGLQVPPSAAPTLAAAALVAAAAAAWASRASAE